MFRLPDPEQTIILQTLSSPLLPKNHTELQWQQISNYLSPESYKSCEKLWLTKFTWQRPLQDFLTHGGEASNAPSTLQFGSGGDVGEGRRNICSNPLPTPPNSNNTHCSLFICNSALSSINSVVELVWLHIVYSSTFSSTYFVNRGVYHSKLRPS